MKKTSLTAAVALSALAFVSCDKFGGTEPVVDRSFEVGATVAFSPDYLRNILTISLQKGEEGEYTFDYSVDNDPSIVLSSVNTYGGSEVASGAGVKLSVGNAMQYMLPKLSDGKHSIVITMTREGVSRTKTISFRSANSLSMVVNANENLSRTKVVVTEASGLKGSYTVSFLLDNEPAPAVRYHNLEMGASQKIDFSLESSFEFELPSLVPGSHTITLVVTTDKGEERTSAIFTEPQRQSVQLSLRYNDISGELQIMSDHNPLGTEFTVALEATVKGQVTWRHKQFFGVADPQTEHYNERGEASTTVKPGLQWQTIDSGVLKSLMDKLYGHTKTDAANGIGNANERTVHSDITMIELKFTIHSLGVQTGNTAVTVYPLEESIPVKFKYKECTYNVSAGTEITYPANLTVNGKQTSFITTL